MKTAAIYIFKASSDKEPKASLKELRSFAKKNNFKVLDEYIDSKDSRESYDLMVSEIRNNKVDIVLVCQLSHLASSTRALIDTFNDFQSFNTHIVSYQESIDASTEHGKEMIKMANAIVQFERDINKERAITRVVQAKKRGVRLGRSPLNEHQQEQIKVQREDGNAIRSIAKDLSLSIGVVHKYIKNNNIQKGTPKKEATIGVSFYLENGSKFTRGKGKVRENIYWTLECEYNAKKLKNSRFDYSFTIKYENEQDLDDRMEDLVCEMHEMAEWRNCYIEPHLHCKELDKAWG